MKIGEFFVELGFMSGDDGKKLNDFARGVGNLNLSSIAAVLGVGALYEAMRRLTDQAVKAGMALHNFGVQTGMDTDKMQQWSFFAEQMGASAEDVASALKSIQTAQTRIRLGQGNAAPFAMLGISVSDDPLKVLDELSKKYKLLRPDLQRLINSEFGLSDAMLNVLKASEAQREEAMRNRGLNKDQVQNIFEMTRQWVALRQALYQAGNAFIATIAPLFRSFGRMLQDVMRGLSGLFSFLMDRFKPAMIVIGAVLLAIWSPLIAAITAFLLVLDDMYAYFDGAESFLKPLWQGIEKVAEGVIYLTDNVSALVGWFEKLGEVVRPAVDLMKQLGVLGGLSAGVVGAGAQAASGGTTNNNNNFNFNLAAGGPMSLVNMIENTIRKVLSDAQYSKKENAT